MSRNPRGDKVFHWTVALGVIDTLAVLLRFFVRKRHATKIGPDDWMIMASLVPTYCTIISVGLRTEKGGFGKHGNELTASQLTLQLKMLIPELISYGVTITAVKMSILLSYHRIFSTVTVTFKRANLAVGFLCITWLCGNIFSEIFFCSPVSAAWDPKLIFSNHCGDFHQFRLGISISNLLLDVVILCMPLPMVWNLNLSTRKKLEVTAVYLLGCFSCISSLVRIVTIKDIKNEDFFYTFLSTYLWCHIEPATAIWCACLMTYRPIITHISSKLQKIFSGSKQIRSDKMLYNRKVSNDHAGSSSDTWPFLGRNLLGQKTAEYGGLGVKGAKGDVHVVDVPLKTASVGSELPLECC